ncbi:MAG TPA: ABC transporter substrate-binding protein [Stellaceae bacterium]|jgi:osmoprotectant transport system substrate-binding protein|nr:ABC transporter substrate-binding protein [Stellaceae bacterium]
MGKIVRLLVVVSALVWAGGAWAAGAVVVGSKLDTEGALLGNMIADALEATGLQVERKIQLGPTSIVRAAILAGQIDVYPEYTGNGAFFFHRESDPVWKNAAEGYATVKALDAARNHIVWLTPAPANNTWVIAIRGDLAGFPARRCLDDLATYLAGGGKFKLAASAEFVESPAALPAFEQTYGFRLKAEQLLTLSGGNTAATLRAAAEGTSGVNAAMAYGTDGELSALGLTALCDDKGAQIVYAPTPVARQTVLDAHPEIAPLLDRIFATLSLETLQSLNARIAVGGEDPNTVAADYLKSKHLSP